MQSSRSPNLWGTWNKVFSTYEIRDGDCTYAITDDQVIELRKVGAVVTCYGGPLDHRNPTRMHEGA